MGEKYMIIIMLGAPGTGKGTVAGILTEKTGMPQVSTGDIFRKHIKEGTELGKLADKYLSKGDLVPDNVTIELIKNRLEEEDVKDGIILDGFPRTVKQAEELDLILNKQGKKVDMVINLTTPEEEIIERIVNRRVCSNHECKAVYNLIMNPPKEEGICDKCGAELIQRKDDNVETFKARLDKYFELTSPLVDYYAKQGNLRTEEVSKKIDRLGKDVAEEIVKDLKNNK
jgi:adenylate kinase